MANAIALQTMVNGPRNYVVKVDFDLDTSDLASTTIVDPSALSVMPDGRAPNRVRLDRIDYSMKDPVELTLKWDASTPVHIVDIAGRGHIDVGRRYGGFENNAGAGVTGKILAVTTGYASGVVSGTFILHCVKQHT